MKSRGLICGEMEGGIKQKSLSEGVLMDGRRAGVKKTYREMKWGLFQVKWRGTFLR